MCTANCRIPIFHVEYFFLVQNNSEMVCLATTAASEIWGKKHEICNESSMNNEKYCLAKNSAHSKKTVRARKRAAVYPTYKLL